MSKFIFVFIVSMFSLFVMQAQELRCNVQIVSQQVQGDKQVYETMKTAVREFMNNQSWTNHVFAPEERIECNILINITEQLGADEFKGTMQVQARRPIYNTSYNSVLLNYLDDDIQFRYVEFQNLDFNENSYTDNLTSILSYYAYIILGLDYDSYAANGGAMWFQKAERIVNNAQSSPRNGWRSTDSKEHKNRFWLIENILDQKFGGVRSFYYKFHRQGLDVMYEKLSSGRNEIVESLELLEDVYQNRPDPFMHFIRVVLDAKREELINILKESTDDEKKRAVRILSKIDAANSSRYDALTKAQ